MRVQSAIQGDYAKLNEEMATILSELEKVYIYPHTDSTPSLEPATPLTRQHGRLS